MTEQVINEESGASIIEVLVSIFILALTCMTVSWNAILAVRFQKQAEIGNVARNLAVSKAEEVAGVRIDLLDDTYDSFEENIKLGDSNILFNRETDITVNPDGSRTVDINITSSSQYLPFPVTYSTTFAPWES